MSQPSHEDDVQNDEVIGRALRASLGVLLAGVLGTLAMLGVRALLREPPPEEQQTTIVLPENRKQEVELPTLSMTDATSESGIDWVHVSGMEGEKLLPETMGGGVAIFDYDRDGDQDILFVGGCSWPWAQNQVDNPRSLCLYQNDGSGKFTDVSADSGLDRTIYGMGPAVGDFDNDGWTDLFITTVGKNLLFKNEEGRFTEVTNAAQVAGDETAWSTGATWLDYDNDGLLDLFVCDYVTWERELDLSIGFSLTGVGRAYGQPTAFTGTQCHLFHNDGDAVFSEVSKAMGVEVLNPHTKVPVGKGLAVSAVDINRDGWTDIMVANDTVRNFLFINYEGEEFVESGIQMGVAFDRSGNATGAMGVDCGFMRNNDSLAIAIGNFANEQSSLYMSRGADPSFVDNAMASGLGPVSRLNLTFGIFFADLDLDTRLDVVCSNGHLESEISKVQATQAYRQPPQFFWNAGSSGSTELALLGEQQIGDAAGKTLVGRAAAYGDLDGDGDLDVVMVSNSGPALLIRNDQELKNNWLRLHLEGTGMSNRSALGTRVELVADGKTQRRVVTATRSYLSQCESVVTFGLGEATSYEELTIHWPDQTQQKLPDLALNQLHRIVQPQ